MTALLILDAGPPARRPKRGHRTHSCLSLLGRLEARTQKSEDGCWLWTGAKSSTGYGQISVNGRSQKAHRVWWSMANCQPFPEGMHGCHTCDNPSCVNPAHIFPGTDADNFRDSQTKGRHGHAKTPENTFTRPSSPNVLQCRECHRRNDRENKRRKAARLRAERAA